MLLRELFEAEQSVGLIFGRFNPPHKGHKAAWEMASENPAWYVGTNKSTQGPKDPLPYDVKIKAMQTIMPEVAKHIVPHQSWLTLASEIYKKHGDVELKVYTDEEWVLKALDKYNGVEGNHGMYNFPKITSVPTPRLSSATALRTAVANNDPKAFADAAGVPADTPVDGKPFFELVGEYLNQYKKEGIKGGLAGAAAGAYLGKGKPKAIVTGYQLGSGAENLLKKKKKKKPENEGAIKRMAQAQSNKADRTASNNKLQPGLDTFKKKPDSKKKISEGFKLQLERGKDMDVLHIVNTDTGGRTEVRGKPGYERGNYDANDKLHQLLDRVGKSANISELINGEVVSINPKHPDGASAKAATDVAYNENFADGKKKGKSRPGRVKRAGASCKGSVSSLRAKAKKYSGERGKMYHWCANMKGGKK